MVKAYEKSERDGDRCRILQSYVSQFFTDLESQGRKVCKGGPCIHPSVFRCPTLLVVLSAFLSSSGHCFVSWK